MSIISYKIPWKNIDSGACNFLSKSGEGLVKFVESQKVLISEMGVYYGGRGKGVNVTIGSGIWGDIEIWKESICNKG